MKNIWGVNKAAQTDVQEDGIWVWTWVFPQCLAGKITEDIRERGTSSVYNEYALLLMHLPFFCFAGGLIHFVGPVVSSLSSQTME